jgi:hypothetical protein
VLIHARGENEHLGEVGDHSIVNVRNSEDAISGSGTPQSTFTFDCVL